MNRKRKKRYTGIARMPRLSIFPNAFAPQGCMMNNAASENIAQRYEMATITRGLLYIGGDDTGNRRASVRQRIRRSADLPKRACQKCRGIIAPQWWQWGA
jgi:hypothetical protein